jgi:hypothetical protein
MYSMTAVGRYRQRRAMLRPMQGENNNVGTLEKLRSFVQLADRCARVGAHDHLLFSIFSMCEILILTLILDGRSSAILPILPFNRRSAQQQME